METTSSDTRQTGFPNTAKIAATAAFVVLILLGLSLFTHEIIDTDLWWHLRTGKFIVESKTVPDADMYSYTAGGNKWIDLHWLFQVILYGTYSILGSYGLSLLFTAVFSAVFALLWAACPKEKNRFVALLFFWLGLMATSSRFLARPEAFTYLMIAAYTMILVKFEQGRCNRLVFALIPLQALWANMQGLFILGPFLIGAFVAQQIASALTSRKLESKTASVQTKKAVTLISVLIGSTIACLANPYGLQGFLFPFTLFTKAGGMENVFARSIAELQPPFSSYNLTLPLKFFAVFLALSAGALVLDFKNLKLSHFIVLAGMGYLALSARRSVPVYVFAILPLAVDHASNLFVRSEEIRNGRYKAWIRRLQSAGCVILALVAIVQTWSVVTNRYYIADRRPERFGFGFKERAFAVGAFDFVKDNGLRGPFFNNMDIGGAFIWQMYPQEKVFIDARLEVNSAEIFSEYQKAMYDPNAFAALSEKYGFNAAIISHVSQDGLYVMPIMYFSPPWALVYLDPMAAVFLKRSRENMEVIAKHEIDISRDYLEPLAPAGVLNDTGPGWLRSILGKRSSIPSPDLEARSRFNLGLVLLVMGQHQRAVEQFLAGLEIVPSSAEAHYNLGLAYEGMGQVEPAMEHYMKTIELKPRHFRAHSNLGKIYDRRGLKDQAVEQYTLAVKYGGKDPIPLYNLGALHFERGDRDAARDCWQRALKIDPAFAPAEEALERLN